MSKNEYIVRCPRCGAEFPEREKFCPHCDTPNRKMICRSCGAQINASAKRCKVCGAQNVKRLTPLQIALIAAASAFIVLLSTVLPKNNTATNAATQQQEQTVDVETRDTALRGFGSAQPEDTPSEESDQQPVEVVAEEPAASSAAENPAPQETPDEAAQQEPVQNEAASRSTHVYVGSTESDKFHYPDCRFAKKILPANERWFSSAQEAKNANYFPCNSCNPR